MYSRAYIYVGRVDKVSQFGKVDLNVQSSNKRVLGTDCVLV